MSDYSDILDHPHFQSPIRPRMSMDDRAAQFSPFVALVGFDAAVEETARLTEEKLILDEDEIMELNRVIETLKSGDMVNITFFLPDRLKEGGMYLPISGTVKKNDTVERNIMLTDGTIIPMSDILSIEKMQ